MNAKKGIATLTGTGAVLALLLSLPAANASNGIQRDAFDVSGSTYVDCLGEFIDYEEHIDIAFHEFETPSGNYHLVDNWTFTVTATGVSTGRMWAGVLKSPGQVNDGPAEVAQFSIRGVLRSLTQHAPSFFWGFEFKTTINANGDMTVLRDSEGTFARCHGKSD